MRRFAFGTVALIALCLASLLVSTGSAPTLAPLKVGFVQRERIVRETRIGKQALQQLKELQAKKQAQIDRMEEEIKKLGDKIANEALPLTEEARDKLRRQQRKKKADLDFFVSEAYDEAKKLNQENMAKIDRMINEAAREIGKEKGYGLIIEKEGIVLYGDPEFDLTDEMIALIDKKTIQQQSGKDKAAK